MTTITVPTTDLQPGDEIVSRESWGTLYDLITSVELPDPPCVVARVNITRTRVEGDTVRGEQTYFLAGIRATHEVERPGPPVRTSYPAPIAYTYEADYHCPGCAARRLGTDAEGYIPEDAEDSEGNQVGAVAPWDEWWNADEWCETLNCGDCSAELDTTHADPHSPNCPEWEPPDEDDDPDPEPEDDDARARRLASEWHGGQGSALYALASTGTVLPGAVEEVRALMAADHEEELAWLLGYVEERQAAPDLAELEAEALARAPWPKTPSMTRCHFEYLARVLAELPTDIVGAAHRRRALVEHVAGHLADTNARFDRERFVEAATGR